MQPGRLGIGKEVTVCVEDVVVDIGPTGRPEDWRLFLIVEVTSSMVLSVIISLAGLGRSERVTPSVGKMYLSQVEETVEEEGRTREKDGRYVNIDSSCVSG